MEVNRLLGDELAYELLVRGVSSDGTVADKRSRLSGILRLERLQGQPLFPNMKVTLNAEEELALCEAKLNELSTACDNLDRDNLVNDSKRILSRILHVTGRLDRIYDRIDDSQREIINRLRLVASEVAAYIDDQQTTQNRAAANQSLIDIPCESAAGPSVPDQSTEEPPENHEPITQPADIRPPQISRTALPTVRIRGNFSDRLQHARLSTPGPSFGRDRFASLDEHLLPGLESPSRIFDTVSKWRLTFDGQTSVTVFLERVEELRSACCIFRSQMLNCATILFTGPALSWFRSIRQTVHSWDELCDELKCTFLPAGYDEDIWSDIRSRTQGKDEKVAMYISVMENLFMKLNEPPKVETRIKIIMRNLLPYLQSHLVLRSIKTISVLRDICMECEDVYIRSMRYKPPPTNPSLVAEPELMYRKPRHALIPSTASLSLEPLAIETPTRSAAPTSLAPTTVPSRLTCWNCQQPGHLRTHCTQPRTQHCYRCGKPGVTVRNCPKCSENRPAVHATES